LNAVPAPAITMADLEVVRECAGSPGPLRRFVPETSSPTQVLMNTPMHAGGGVGGRGARFGVDDSPSYTLSPLSSLKAERKFEHLEKGASPMSHASSASPPVAVYSYAPSAGSARSMNGNGGNLLVEIRPSSLVPCRTRDLVRRSETEPAGPSPPSSSRGRRSGRRGMNISKKCLIFCSKREAMGGCPSKVNRASAVAVVNR